MNIPRARTNFEVGTFPARSLQTNLASNVYQANFLRMGQQTDAVQWLVRYHDTMSGFLRVICFLGDRPSNLHERLMMHGSIYAMMVYEENNRELYATNAANFPHIVVRPHFY